MVMGYYSNSEVENRDYGYETLESNFRYLIFESMYFKTFMLHGLRFNWDGMRLQASP